MSSFTTPAVVLKHSNFGEADRLLTVLTPFKGKIKIVAKGVRRITSRRAGNVEPLNIVKIHLFAGKGMPILTEAESIENFSKIKNDMTLSVYGSHIVEITDKLIPENQTILESFNLLSSVLHLLEENPRQIFIRAYEVKLLSILGFWSTNQIQTTENINEILQKLLVLSWDEIDKISLNKQEALELERTLMYYLEGVLESSLKSMQMIKKLKNNE